MDTKLEPNQLIAVSALQLAGTPDELEAASGDIQWIGDLCLASLKNKAGSYSLIDRAKMLDATLSMKAINEMCIAGGNNPLPEKLGRRVVPFNTFVPDVHELLSVFVQLAHEAKKEYAEGSANSIPPLVALIERPFSHVLPALAHMTNNMPLWHRLLKLAALVIAPALPQPQGPSVASSGSDSVGSICTERNLADFEDDEEDKVRLAALEKVRKESRAQDLLGVHVSKRATPDAIKQLTAGDVSQELISSRLFNKMLNDVRAVSIAHERLGVLMEVADKVTVLNVDGMNQADVMLAALPALRRADVPGELANEWRNFLCRLVQHELAPLQSSAYRGSWLESAAGALGEDLNSLETRAGRRVDAAWIPTTGRVARNQAMSLAQKVANLMEVIDGPAGNLGPGQARAGLPAATGEATPNEPLA